MNATALTAFGLFVLAALLSIAQLWLGVMSHETYLKCLITLGIILGLVLAWALLQRERRESAKLRDPEQR